MTHLYLGTGRNPDQVSFRGFWMLPPQHEQPSEPDPVIAAELDAGNQGLLALCDLAGDLERPTPLNRLVARRAPRHDIGLWLCTTCCSATSTITDGSTASLSTTFETRS